MHSALLTTKLRIPPVPRNNVPRSHLVDQIESSIPNIKLVLLCAPAGYGKTTLLSQWASTTALDVAWLTVGSDDRDAAKFLRYLFSAWEAIDTDIANSDLAATVQAMAPDVDAVLAALVNEVSARSSHKVFVFDDLRRSSDDEIFRCIEFLLDNAPPNLSIVIGTRSEPRLPIARFRAQGDVLDITAEALTFTKDEANAFLNSFPDLALTPSEGERLAESTGGWIAVLQLASTALRLGADAKTIDGSGDYKRFISDYIRQEVLATLDTELFDFLIQTSILQTFSASLCETVTGRRDSVTLLRQLEAENLILAVDSSSEWFRHHPLIHDVIQSEYGLQPTEQTQAAHARAAGWYLDHDIPDDAFAHALASNNLEQMIAVGERYMIQKLHAGEFGTLRRWLDSIPSAWHEAHPGFRLTEAGLLAFSGQFDLCHRSLDRIEEEWLALGPKDLEEQVARVTALRCFIACMQNDLPTAIHLANTALTCLDHEDYSFRADVHQAMGDTYRRNGFWDEARESYMRALGLARLPSSRYLTPHVFGALADLELRQGRLHSAFNYWRQSLSVIEDRQSWGQLPGSIIGWVYIRIAEIYYEWDQREEAQEHLTRGLRFAEAAGDERGNVFGNILAARLAMCDSNVELAQDHLNRISVLLAETRIPDWHARYHQCQLDVWLRQGMLRTAVRWADESLSPSAARTLPDSELTRLAVCRVLITKADSQSMKLARSILADVQQLAGSEDRIGRCIQCHILVSILSWTEGDQGTSVREMIRALKFAEPENYVRTFLDADSQVVDILRATLTHEEVGDYAGKLLRIDERRLTERGTRFHSALLDPLTPRELEVLQLLADGLSNREIADQLFISPETVKKHAGSIYGKLDVRSRVAAVTKANDLELLS